LTVILDGLLVVDALDKSSPLHGEARDILLDVMQGVYGPAYITDYEVLRVIEEAGARAGREAALKAGRLLLEKKPFIILYASEDVVEEAWELFKAAGTGLGLSEALLLACARAYNIEYIATLNKELAKLYPVVTRRRRRAV